MRFQPLGEPVESIRAIDLTGKVARIHTAPLPSATATPSTAQTAIDLRRERGRVEIVLPLAVADPEPPMPLRAPADAIEAPPIPGDVRSADRTDSSNPAQPSEMTGAPDPSDRPARSGRPRNRGIFTWLRLAQSRPNRPRRPIAEPSRALVPISAGATRPSSPLPALRPVAFAPVVRTPPVVHLCPACGEEGRVDIADPNLGEIYLSCPNCFKMWQVEVERAIAS